MTEPEVQSDLSKPSDVAADTTSGTASARRFPWIAAILGVALIGALIAVVTTTKSLSNRDSKLAVYTAANEARTQAIVYGKQMTTYDYKTADKDFQWITTGGTADWARQYSPVIDSLKKLVVDIKSTAVGNVVNAAAIPGDRTHATVILMVDQTLTSATSTQPRTAASNIVMKMIKQNGKWVVDDVQLH